MATTAHENGVMSLISNIRPCAKSDVVFFRETLIFRKLLF